MLLCAALKGRTELVQKLVRDDNNLKVTIYIQLHSCSKCQAMNIQQGILKAQWNGKSALILAAQGGHTDTVKALLNAGADVSKASNIMHNINMKRLTTSPVAS